MIKDRHYAAITYFSFFSFLAAAFFTLLFMLAPKSYSQESTISLPVSPSKTALVSVDNLTYNNKTVSIGIKKPVASLPMPKASIAVLGLTIESKPSTAAPVPVTTPIVLPPIAAKPASSPVQLPLFTHVAVSKGVSKSFKKNDHQSTVLKAKSSPAISSHSSNKLKQQLPKNSIVVSTKNRIISTFLISTTANIPTSKDSMHKNPNWLQSALCSLLYGDVSCIDMMPTSLLLSGAHSQHSSIVTYGYLKTSSFNVPTTISKHTTTFSSFQSAEKPSPGSYPD